MRWPRSDHHRHSRANALRYHGIERNHGRTAKGWRRLMTSQKTKIPTRKAGGRSASFERNTTETQIAINLTIEGQGKYKVSTGIRFFDHMLELFTRHGAFNLEL